RLLELRSFAAPTLPNGLIPGLFFSATRRPTLASTPRKRQVVRHGPHWRDVPLQAASVPRQQRRGNSPNPLQNGAWKGPMSDVPRRVLVPAPAGSGRERRIPGAHFRLHAWHRERFADTLRLRLRE